MKERGIIMSGQNPARLLDGSKTQARRVVKPQPEAFEENYDKIVPCKFSTDGNDTHVSILCPYGVAGDRLWVRETFKRHINADGKVLVSYRDSGTWCDTSGVILPSPLFAQDYRWRPSIHMPRWASRITLEITGVRVERLQDISEEDAWAEGCKRGEPTDNGGYFPADELDDPGDPKSSATGWDCSRDWYADLWDSLHGKGAWERNDWVWVLQFKKL